jgi:hypothetical protein
MDWLTIALLVLIVGSVVVVLLVGSSRKGAAAQSPELLRQASERAALAEHKYRVQQIANWEAAYSELHPGEAIPAMPASFAPVAPSLPQQTNTLAILALIFGLGGGVLGILFGHVAHAQIRRTGEKGWGLATAGLIFGYIGLAVIAIALIMAATAHR